MLDNQLSGTEDNEATSLYLRRYEAALYRCKKLLTAISPADQTITLHTVVANAAEMYEAQLQRRHPCHNLTSQPQRNPSPCTKSPYCCRKTTALWSTGNNRAIIVVVASNPLRQAYAAAINAAINSR